MSLDNHPDSLSESFLRHVGDYVLVETPLARADVCIVFGNNQHPDHLAAHAAELYHKGYFKRVIVSGAPVTDDGRTEAARMQSVMVAAGVPAADIIVEDQARDTPENVKYCMALLEKEIGLKNIKSVLAVGHIHASRRFLMTLERSWPDVIKMFSTDNCFAVARDAWHKDAAFRQMVLVEYQRMADHKARDIVHEIDLEKIRKNVANLPPPRSNAA